MAARSTILAVFCSTLFSLAFTANAQQDASSQTDKKPPECSLAKTNGSCVLILDRTHPIAPTTIQMYSDQTLTVILEKPNGFERYFMDYQSGQATLKPDVISSMVPGILTSLAKLAAAPPKPQSPVEALPSNACDAFSKDPVPGAGTTWTTSTIDTDARSCALDLYQTAVKIYENLEPFVAPDSTTPNSMAPDTSNLKGILDSISLFVTTEVAFSVEISAISATQAKPQSNDDGREIALLTQLKTGADAIANDLMGYQVRIRDFLRFTPAETIGIQNNCSNLVQLSKGEPNPSPCVVIRVTPDAPSIYRGMVSRSISYSLTVYNLISNPQEAVPDPTKKKQLEAITLNFADSTTKTIAAFRWEGSAGTWFSTLPMRSFTAGPVFTSGTVTNKIILQNIIHPMVIPFGAANYRLTNDLKFSRWKTNLYWTVAAGVNPNTVTTDFGTGLSFSYRSLVISNLAHFGHDVRLAQGLTPGESLGAGFNGSIPTQTYWTVAYGFGVSIRLPALPGR